MNIVRVNVAAAIAVREHVHGVIFLVFVVGVLGGGDIIIDGVRPRKKNSGSGHIRAGCCPNRREGYERDKVSEGKLDVQLEEFQVQRYND